MDAVERYGWPVRALHWAVAGLVAAALAALPAGEKHLWFGGLRTLHGDLAWSRLALVAWPVASARRHGRAFRQRMGLWA